MEIFSVDDRQAMCDTFSRLLGDMADEEKLRKLIDTELGFDQQLWDKMAELGLTGIMVPPEHDGIGGGIVEVEALMEIAGAYLYSGPFITTCVIAPTIIAACNSDKSASELLREIASGSAIVAVAGCGQGGDWSARPEVEAQDTEGAWELTGTAGFVSHLAIAKYCLVYANTTSGIGVFVVEMEDPGIEVTHHNVDDATQRLSSLSFDGAKAHRLTSVGQQEIDTALANALVALAGEQVGAARRIFEITIEYMKTRHQFGQTIGSFQALKHMAADLLIDLESASSAARHAARAVATGSEDQRQMVFLAGFSCADNFRKIAADAIQLHGGIAYTMEHPAHLFWRRAQTGQWLYCSSSSLRDMYLSEMEKML